MLIIGCGNRTAAMTLLECWSRRACGNWGYDAQKWRGDAADLIESWSGVDDVVVVDAVMTGAPAGSVTRGTASIHLLPPVQRLRRMDWAWRKRSDWLRFYSAFQRGCGSTGSRDGDSNPGSRSLPKYSVLSRKWCEKSLPA